MPMYCFECDTGYRVGGDCKCLYVLGPLSVLRGLQLLAKLWTPPDDLTPPFLRLPKKVASNA